MAAKTDGRRVARVEREVHSVISTFIIQRLQAELPGIITVSRVQIPADLRVANVYVSLLQIGAVTDDDSFATDARAPKVKKELSVLEKSIKILQHWASDIQHEIGHKLQLKYVPKITFFADVSTEKILKIEKLISTLSADSELAKKELADDDSDFDLDSDSE